MIAYGLEVAYRLRYAQEGVFHIFLELQATHAGVVHLAHHANQRGIVDLAAADLDAYACLGGIGDILDVHVEHTRMILLQVGHRVASVAQVVAHIQTHADAGIKILGVLPHVGRVGIGLDVGPCKWIA